MVDFNGDSNADLVVYVNGGSSLFAILFGNGNGTFQTKQSFGVRRLAWRDRPSRTTSTATGSQDLRNPDAGDGTVSVLLRRWDDDRRDYHELPRPPRPPRPERPP